MTLVHSINSLQRIATVIAIINDSLEGDAQCNSFLYMFCRNYSHITFRNVDGFWKYRQYNVQCTIYNVCTMYVCFVMVTPQKALEGLRYCLVLSTVAPDWEAIRSDRRRMIARSWQTYLRIVPRAYQVRLDGHIYPLKKAFVESVFSDKTHFRDSSYTICNVFCCVDWWDYRMGNIGHHHPYGTLRHVTTFDRTV